MRKPATLKPNRNFCRCSGCGEYFRSVSAFDLHRKSVAGVRSCVPPADLVNRKGERRLKLNDAGYWMSAAPNRWAAAKNWIEQLPQQSAVGPRSVPGSAAAIGTSRPD